jgi:hypothetical protein
MLMEPIFAADFYTGSHGFRRVRSTQTALRDVARRFPRTTWTIEGDIVGCFDPSLRCIGIYGPRNPVFARPSCGKSSKYIDTCSLK